MISLLIYGRKNSIDEIQIYQEPTGKGQILKHIKSKFPVFYTGNEVQKLSLNRKNAVEMLCLLSYEIRTGCSFQ